MGARILVATWDGGGVVPPMLGLARKLVDRGHELLVLGDPTLAPEAAAAGCAFRPWRRAPHRHSRAPEHDLLRDYAYQNPVRFFREELRPYHIDPGPEWTQDTLDAIDAHDAELVLSDVALLWPLVAAEARSLPGVALATLPLPVPYPGRPPSGAALLAVPRPLHGLRDAGLRGLTEWVYDRWLPTLGRVRALHGLPPLPHALDQVRGAAALLVATSPVLDPPGPTPPPNTHWIGPLLDDPSWCAAWTPAPDARGEPLVLVALSSTYQDQVPLLLRLVQALDGLPVRGLVTLGPAVAPERVPGTDRVRVVSSAPHQRILQDAAVLVSHGGHGILVKGLAVGVPQLVVPFGRDQPDNAARLVALGAGLRLGRGATVERLRTAIGRLLDEPGFRTRAGEVAGQLATHAGEVDACAVVEDLLAAAPASQAAGAGPTSG